MQHTVTNWHVDRNRTADWEAIIRELDLLAENAAGFLDTRMLRSVEHPGKFVIYARWQSRAQWDDYFGQAEVQALFRKTFPLLKGPPQQEWFDLVAEVPAPAAG